MAFPRFPRLPGKDKQAEGRAKPELAPRHDARPTAGPVSAREVAAAAAKGRPPHAIKLRPSRAAVDARERDITVTGPPSLIEWAPAVPGAQPSIQVAEANPGLCSVLENAALLYASGHAAPARQVLEQGVATDNDAKVSPLAWLALFDLLERANDRAAFEQLALQYVVAFERSAPAWEEREPQLRPGTTPAPSCSPTPSPSCASANMRWLCSIRKKSGARWKRQWLRGAMRARATGRCCSSCCSGKTIARVSRTARSTSRLPSSSHRPLGSRRRVQQPSTRLWMRPPLRRRPRKCFAGRGR